jgi:hypothetical protein
MKYIKNSKHNHEQVKIAYNVLRESNESSQVPIPIELFGGIDLHNKDYVDIVNQNPKLEDEYLRGPYIAIPTTNPIITELYESYYLLECELATLPKDFSDRSSLFTQMETHNYRLSVSSPMIIAFMDACLNTEQKLGSTQDFEKFCYYLVYNYIEHVSMMDHYMTYEQKGMELARNDLIYWCANYSFAHITNQLVDLVPFIFEGVKKNGNDAFVLQPNGIHFIKDSERLLEAFKLLKTKQSIWSRISPADGYLVHPRGPRPILDSRKNLERYLIKLKKLLITK